MCAVPSIDTKPCTDLAARARHHRTRAHRTPELMLCHALACERQLRFERSGQAAPKAWIRHRRRRSMPETHAASPDEVIRRAAAAPIDSKANKGHERLLVQHERRIWRCSCSRCELSRTCSASTCASGHDAAEQKRVWRQEMGGGRGSRGRGARSVHLMRQGRLARCGSCPAMLDYGGVKESYLP